MCMDRTVDAEGNAFEPPECADNTQYANSKEYILRIKGQPSRPKDKMV